MVKLLLVSLFRYLNLFLLAFHLVNFLVYHLKHFVNLRQTLRINLLLGSQRGYFLVDFLNFLDCSA